MMLQNSDMTREHKLSDASDSHVARCYYKIKLHRSFDIRVIHWIHDGLSLDRVFHLDRRPRSLLPSFPIGQIPPLGSRNWGGLVWPSLLRFYCSHGGFVNECLS